MHSGVMSDLDAPRTPSKMLAGMEYDFRKPTPARAKSRMWNPDDKRLFTPKTFGWGWDVNVYWLAHPAGLVKRKN